MKRYNIYNIKAVVATTTSKKEASDICFKNNIHVDFGMFKKGQKHLRYERVSVMVNVPVSILDEDKVYKDAERASKFELMKED